VPPRLRAVLLFLCVAFPVAIGYAGGRTAHVGFDLRFTLMLLPFTPLLVLSCGVVPTIAGFVLLAALLAPLLPARAETRWRSGACPGCGYDRRGGGTTCPECGEAWGPPPPRLTSAVRHVLLPIVAGWLLGGALGETYALLDEAAFRREVQRFEEGAGTGNYARPRWWPNGSNSILYERDRGFWGNC
jgi:hypothetical protein